VEAKVLEVVSLKDKTAIVLDTSPFYAEMGGQVGDTGEISGGGNLWRISNTQKSGNTFLHFIDGGARPSRSQFVASRDEHSVGGADRCGRDARAPVPRNVVTLSVDRERRNTISTSSHGDAFAPLGVAPKSPARKRRRKVPSSAGQVDFDFNSAPLTPAQVADIEKLVNNASSTTRRLVDGSRACGREEPQGRDAILRDKYGDTVRVSRSAATPGSSTVIRWSCAAAHTRARRARSVCSASSAKRRWRRRSTHRSRRGLTAFDSMKLDRELIRTVAGKVNSPVGELEKKSKRCSRIKRIGEANQVRATTRGVQCRERIAATHPDRERIPSDHPQRRRCGPEISCKPSPMP